MNSIVVSVKVSGFHRWESCNIEKVMFLKDSHRHLFEIKLEVGVSEDDRQVEFFLLQNQLKEFFESNYPVKNGLGFEFGSRSCEMIGKEIFKAFIEKGYKVLSVSVFEDGENGAIIREV